MPNRSTERILPPVEQWVYVRRAKVAQPRIDGGTTEGYELDRRLRCEWVRQETGPDAGRAVFSYIPDDGAQPGFEEMLARYTTDDQVVVVVSNPDAGGFRPKYEALFEDVLTRHTSRVNGDAQGEDERAGFVAMPMPWLDNELSDHLIRGRWIYDETSEPPGFWTVETPALPAVFNFRGRGNCAANGPKVTLKVSGPTEEELIAPGWTHDDDPDGEPWTVRTAMASILAAMLYGADKAKPRPVDLDSVTAAQLSGKDVAEVIQGRFDGLDATLPEVDVQGLGVFQTFDRVAKAGGFDWAMQPLHGDDWDGIGSDRRYWLTIWRRGSGTKKHLDLPKRGSTFDDARDLHRSANVPRINGMADAEPVVNEASAAGEVMIEATFLLKPLWHPDDVDGAAIDSKLQADGDSSYHQKHVVGGERFTEFGHVGRLWGLDCVGGFSGYESGDYKQPEDGFDFVAHLKLNEAGGPYERFIAEREANGIGEPIRWTKGIRTPQPLHSPDAVAEGRQFVLQVSEDGGSTWEDCEVGIETLADGYLGALTEPWNLLLPGS